MAQGLSTQRLVNVNVSLSAAPAQFANFNSLLIVGDSNVIDVGERIRSYSTLAGVAADFGTSVPEYKAAALYFSQTPTPTQLYVGRWAQTATAGLLKGAILTSAQSAASAWTSITAGGFKVTIDGVLKTLGSLNFSSVTNMNNVATIVNAALTGGVMSWDGTKFIITSSTTGATSTVSYAIAPASGTDISAMLGLTTGVASPPVAGISAETAIAAVTILDNLPTTWYALKLASTNAVDADHAAIAAYIEATKHVYGVPTSNTGVLSSAVTNDIASTLKAAGCNRTFVQYSQTPYAAAAFFGRALTVDFSANNSMITMMYKQENGVTPETLTPAQADALISKRCNFYVYYDNNTAIVQNAVMCKDAFFDEIHGTDWLANQIQTNVFNLLFTASSKIPQTDQGMNQVVGAIEFACEAALYNGLLGAGTWTAGGFGTLKTNQYLEKGYYVYAPPIAQQASADRAARKTVSIIVGVKLAGAVHSTVINVNVNR